MTEKNIIWLASYPKSGNTWFRIFLTNLLQKRETPANINNIEGAPIASSRQMFDQATGLSSSDLTSYEIEQLRPTVYRVLSKSYTNLTFHKIHDAYTLLPSGEPLIPSDITLGAIYFIRNPLDVAVSFAHHTNKNAAAMIKAMNDDQYSFCEKKGRLHNQLMQKLDTWSGHVESWTSQKAFPVHLVRYEDLLSNPVAEFTKAIRFAGLQFTVSEIEKAVKFSSFTEVKKQEEIEGFKERSPSAENFFRKGIRDDWKKELTSKEVEEVLQNHSEMMKKYGYLP